MRIAPVLKAPLGGRFYSVAFLPILPSFLSRHTRHNSAKPKSDPQANHCSHQYLCQYLADEDVLSNHPLRMYCGQIDACAIWLHILAVVGLAFHGEREKMGKKIHVTLTKSVDRL